MITFPMVRFVGHVAGHGDQIGTVQCLLAFLALLHVLMPEAS